MFAKTIPPNVAAAYAVVPHCARKRRVVGELVWSFEIRPVWGEHPAMVRAPEAFFLREAVGKGRATMRAALRDETEAA